MDNRISSNRYNQIPHIDDQGIPAHSYLVGVGEIITRHNLQSQFGVHLLHRHFNVSPDTVIFQSVDGGKEISRMTDLKDLDATRISPQCFLFDGEAGFISYEYAYDDSTPSLIPEPLASELATHFAQNEHLSQLLAIEKINGNTEAVYREHPYGEFATYRVEVHDEDRTPDVATDTAWCFRKLENGAVSVQRTCQWRAYC